MVSGEVHSVQGNQVLIDGLSYLHPGEEDVPINDYAVLSPTEN